MTAVAKWARQQLQVPGTDVGSFVLLPPKTQLPAAGLIAEGAVQWLKVGFGAWHDASQCAQMYQG